MLCDIIILAAPSHVAKHAHFSSTILFRCCVHSTLLLLECCVKRSKALDESSTPSSPEERHGILNRAFFIWINPILLRGYTSILVNQNLPTLSQYMKPKLTREAIIKSWSQRGQSKSRCIFFPCLLTKTAKPETKMSLPLALMRCLKQPFLAAIVPRLFLIFFRYSQPILIRESIRYVVRYPMNAETNQGFWLVLSAVVVYVGLAVSPGFDSLTYFSRANVQHSCRQPYMNIA
jgi:ATP-binding cassette, subfamily C (CFTR/MRP), member 1